MTFRPRTLAVLLALVPTVLARDASSADPELGATERATVVRQAAAALREAYVFPDAGKRLERDLLRRWRGGRWERVTSAAAFAESLTAHLQLLTQDLHLRVFTAPAPAGGGSEAPSAARAREARESRRQNHGFERVERLAGNVGYLDLRAFLDPGAAGETAEAAMRFLAGTDALVVDLRQNGGGRPEMVALVASYFFEPGAHVHLNDIHSRLDGGIQQYWTLPHVPGPRYLDRDVFLLVSRATFSAAEELAYDLQQLGRATVVGEPTAGAAHPVTFRALGERFTIAVPFARSVNPVTRTNWQGTGVTPDLEAPAAEALRVAHATALERLAARARDDLARGELTELARLVRAGGALAPASARRSM